jgi:hypothetical protein
MERGRKALALVAAPRDGFRGEDPAVDSGALERLSQAPIWVHLKSSDDVLDLFRRIFNELSGCGFGCHDGGQPDPHPELKLIAFFEVTMRPEGKREPEQYGTISLYGDGKPLLIKILPDCPGYSEMFLSALARVIESKVEALGAAGGPKSLDVVVRQEHKFELPK